MTFARELSATATKVDSRDVYAARTRCLSPSTVARNGATAVDVLDWDILDISKGARREGRTPGQLSAPEASHHLVPGMLGALGGVIEAAVELLPVIGGGARSLAQ